MVLWCTPSLLCMEAFMEWVQYDMNAPPPNVKTWMGRSVLKARKYLTSHHSG